MNLRLASVAIVISTVPLAEIASGAQIETGSQTSAEMPQGDPRQPVVLAQAEVPQEQGQQSDAMDDPEALEEIVVTGSRIGRGSRFDTLAPALSMDDEELSNRSFVNIADALREIPGFGQGINPTGAQSPVMNGANYADLFGLGSQRTLTLIDGRRVVTSNPPSLFGADDPSRIVAGGQQVDLNILPLSLVDRVEVLSVGGAPIYGSDAIAGTVNIIMKDDFEGYEFTAQYGGIEDGGDPESYSFRMAWGANILEDRGNVAIGVDWSSVEGAIATDFPELFGADPAFQEIPSLRDVTGDGIPDDVNVLVRDMRLIVLGAPGRPLLSPTPFFVPNGPALGFSQEEADAATFFSNSPGQYMQLNESGELIEFNPGDIIPSNGVFAPAGSTGNGYDLDELNGAGGVGGANISSPVERASVFVNSHYKVSEGIDAFGQFMFANTEAKTLIDQVEHQSFLFGGSTFALGFPIDTPFLSEDVRQQLIDAGVNNPTQLQQDLGALPGFFFINRSINDVQDRGRSETEMSLWRFVGGLRGDFELLDRDWTWEGALNFGESNLTTTSARINDPAYFNAVDAVRLTAADIQSVADFLGGTEAALEELDRLSGTDNPSVGDVVCRAVLEAARGNLPPVQGPAGAVRDVRPFVDGCVPLNLLGANYDPRALEFIRLKTIMTSEMQQRIFTLSTTGELIELPAGWLKMAVGYESRRERASFDGDEATNIGIFRQSRVQDTFGEFTTDEGFIELSAPIVSPDMSFGEELLGFTAIDRLSLQGAARIMDNSIAGEDTIWTVGGNVTFGGVLSDLVIRGNVTRSARSPSIQEVFSPLTETLSRADDPCDVRNVNEGPAPQNRQTNCSAIGIDPNFFSIIGTVERTGQTGGNKDLKVERAEAWTIGAAFTPRWVPDLSLAVDYIEIEIMDQITELGLTQQLRACFDQDPSTFDPDEGVCAGIQRDDAGQITDFQIGFANAARSIFRGVQMEASYNFDLSNLFAPVIPGSADLDLGSIYLSSRVFHRVERELSVIGEASDPTIGGFSEPKWSGSSDIIWDRGPMQAFWRIIWQDGAKLDPTGDNFFQDANGNLITETDARFINNASIAYNVHESLTLQLSIDNVFDRRASDVEWAAGHFTNDEIFGRQFKFRVTSRF